MNTKYSTPTLFCIVQQTKMFQQTLKIKDLNNGYHAQFYLQQQPSLNYQIRFMFWKSSKDQNTKEEKNSLFKYFSNQKEQKEQPSENKVSKIQFFNFFQKSQKKIVTQYENLEKKSYFELSQLKYLLQDQISKLGYIGKASYKYFLIGVFVLGFAYSIPKSISTFFATKMAISAQLSIDNLKKENDILKSKLEFVQNQLNSEKAKQNELKQNNYQY
ncbi:unnamed protein product [Paramecium sonneborni]|uniref:Transmembrane protein n=1 Tax=Paramecium sonneborni TaxID=65129 RepID=A0A8S1RBA0_9CILI|nr:unnamed protein product [Paramecium sonneborni]